MLLGVSAMLLQLLASSSPQDGRLLRDARAAQGRFEAVRRMHLPREWRGDVGSRCDARIGRYCYTYDSIEAPPPPEPREIIESRNGLIRLLDSAAVRTPSDPWIAGQRVRYLLEANRTDDAIGAAHNCAAAGWWCAALEGLALHVAERYESADSLFRVALERMPTAQRCEWMDLRLLVEVQLARQLKKASCAERAAFADQLWTLGQPLWSTRGNDLRTEHFARLTMAALLTGSANAHGMSFGADSRELVLRYGWAEWFTRQDSPSVLYASPAITGHDREPSYYFFPDVARVGVTPQLSPSSWKLRSPIAPSRYAPRHIKALGELPHQLVRFPRGDSLAIAVAFTLPDTAMAAESVSAYFGVLQRGELRVAGPRSGTSVLWMTMRNDTAIVSVEARGGRTTSEHAARARYTVEPLARRGGASLSDLLLYDASRTGSASGAQTLMTVANTGAPIATRTPLGVYWEIEGFPAGTPLTFGITVEPVGIGIARRVATRLHLAPRLAPVRLRWQSVSRGAIDGTSVALRLPPRARGRFRVVLTVERADAPALTASRYVELAP